MAIHYSQNLATLELWQLKFVDKNFQNAKYVPKSHPVRDNFMHDDTPFLTVGKTAMLEATIGGSNDLVTAVYPLVLAKKFYKVTKKNILKYCQPYMNIHE